MIKAFFLILIPFFAFAGELQLEKTSLHQIGLKVWQNECRGTLDGLIIWSANEDFPSLGIGHFIWYPKGAEKKFQETFPAFLTFLKEKEVEIPSWMNPKKGCPWKTREDFLKAKRSKKMLQLRDLLSDTLDHQITFIFERFKLAEKQLLPYLTEPAKAHLETLKASPQGVYALIDYVNFKGTGLSTKERYRGEGWGLLQVLQTIPKNSTDDKLVEAFVLSAKQLLLKRIKNAPIHRKEERFQKGWYKRLETYSSSSL